MSASRRRAIAIAALFGASVFLVAFVVLFLLLGVLAVVPALLVAGAWVGLAWLRADATVLDLADAEPADEQSHARLFNVTAGLCAAMGVSPPDLYVVEDDARNAMAVGRDAHHSALVVTQGLLEVLSLVELEAVVAHQLFRIKSGEVVPETFVVPTVGASVALAERLDGIEWLQRIVSVPTPLVERVLVRLHPGQSDLDTDIAAMQFTRYPPALATALEKMSGRSALAMGTPATAHLWIAPPLSATSRPSVVHMHAPIAERVAVLQEM